ncbi:MAG: rod-binding protein [Hyphomicrobiales bacterium]|jgi:flagellar protein FlgJ|nr:rod-binding protein [Hyphomicrobiales bacterium]
MTLALPGLALPAAKLALSATASALSAVKKALTPDEQKIRKTADDFETMFLENMMSQVFPQESSEGPLGENGTGGSVYRGMLVNEYAKSVAKSGGIGISDTIYRQMLQMQERNNAG